MHRAASGGLSVLAQGWRRWCLGSPCVTPPLPACELPAPLARGQLGQLRTKVVIPEKRLTKKASRSSGPGGQSVNMADSRVQLSFQMDTADWIPQPIREKMRELHKNRISSKGELSVASQVTSSQMENYRLALAKIQELIDEAEKALESEAAWESQKMDWKDWVVEKKKREGREWELEKREEAIKDQKRRSRDRTKSKKMSFD